MTLTQAIDWEGRYREGRTGWERQGPHPCFLAWRENGALAPPGRVLVPGAGRSEEPLRLAEAGFSVTVVDAAPSAVAVQQERLKGTGGEAFVADLFTWDPPTPFDLIYEQTCLCALPPGLWPDYAARLARWLRPGGRLFALFMQTETEGGPPFHCDLAAMHALFGAELWSWPERLPDPVAHPAIGREQPAILLRR